MFQSTDLLTVEAGFRCSAATFELGRFHLPVPIDGLLEIGEGYHLDMCLTKRPQNARARYVNRWGPNRFERIGSLFLVRDAEPVHARSDPGEGIMLGCQLRPEAIGEWFDGDLTWTDHRLEAGFDIESATMKGLFQRIAAELRNPGFAHDVLMEAIVTQVAVELQRYCTALGTRKGEGLAPWRLRTIDERLNDQLEQPTLSELAQLCQMSVRQLTRAFRASRGCSIAEYVAAKRLEHAKRMIASGDTIKAVASILGFSSSSSFTFSFRSATSLTPGEFRESVAGLKPN